MYLMVLQHSHMLAVAAGHCWQLGLALLPELSWLGPLMLRLSWLGWHELLQRCLGEPQNTDACQRLLQPYLQT